MRVRPAYDGVHSRALNCGAGFVVGSSTLLKNTAAQTTDVNQGTYCAAGARTTDKVNSLSNLLNDHQPVIHQAILALQQLQLAAITYDEAPTARVVRLCKLDIINATYSKCYASA
jgi:hypothetical protein